MGRKCSQCGITGHNSRTCTNTTVKGCNGNNNKNTNNVVVVGVGGLRLFGVQLDISSPSSSSSSLYSSSPSSSSTTNSSAAAAMKKSLSLDCLSSSPSSSPLSSSRLLSVNENCEIKTSINGYLSDGIGKAQEKRKGVPWTEQEHRKFLIGLEKLGKGDWRGIARNFVTTRTPTQVASHAQKYFLRQTSLNHKKRRTSLFDMVGSHGHKANHEDDQENVHSLINLNSFGDDDQEMMVMMTTINDDNDDDQDNNCKASSNHHHYAEAIDLELALGAPKDVDKPKPSSTSLILGPISVT